MRRLFGLSVGVVLMAMAASCGGKGNPGATAARTAAGERDTATYQLPLPVVPPAITDREEKVAFVARHYWDAMDWNDTLLLSSERFMGESMATFGFLLSTVSDDVRVQAVEKAAEASSANPRALKAFADYANKYFYYPDAPQHDDELYLVFVDAFLQNEKLDEAERQRLGERRRDIMKNRLGSVATDFTYVGTDGQRHQLLATAPDAQIRILMMYDPDCEACEEAVQIMKGGEGFVKAQRDGDVQVIAINAFGQKEGGAAKRKDSFPAEWIVGYSPAGQIDEDEIYVIRATPAIYVLNPAGEILDKDLSLAKLAQIVSN